MKARRAGTSSTGAGTGPHLPASRPPSQPREAHWTAGGGGERPGAAPAHTLTWLLVVMADYDEVVGQPGHGLPPPRREAGARAALAAAAHRAREGSSISLQQQ